MRKKIWTPGIILVVIWLVGCGETSNNTNGWAHEQEEPLPPVTQGVYQLENVEVTNSQCSKPSLGSILDENQWRPPIAMKFQDGVFITIRGLRRGVFYNVGFALDSENRPETSRPITEGERICDPKVLYTCGRRGEAHPLNEMYYELRSKKQDLYELDIRMRWTCEGDCQRQEQYDDWVPNNLPCEEAYTLTYELAEACEPVDSCRVRTDFSGEPNSAVRRKRDYYCDCDS